MWFEVVIDVDAEVEICAVVARSEERKLPNRAEHLESLRIPLVPVEHLDFLWHILVVLDDPVVTMSIDTNPLT